MSKKQIILKTSHLLSKSEDKNQKVCIKFILSNKRKKPEEKNILKIELVDSLPTQL